MRILILTQWFYPENHFKGLPFAKELAKRGHEVQVLTGFPNYPGGKVFPGYRIQLFKKEMIDGISVIRVALYPSHDRSAIKRMLNYASFAFSAGVMGPLLTRSADVLYVYHPPPTVGFAAITLRLFRRLRFVYDVQDLWPDSLAATGMIRNKAALSLVSGWCSMVYRFATRIAVLSPGFKLRLQERGVPANKISVLYNWSPDEEEGDPMATPQPPGWAGRFNVLFAGNMGAAQALDCVLEAARSLQSKGSLTQFIFLGSGIAVDGLKSKAEEFRLGNVKFLPRVSGGEVRALACHADALLVHLRNDPLFTITIPSKTQAYLAAGKPILMGVEGDAAQLVHDAGAGFAFTPENPDSLVTAVEKLRNLSTEERQTLGESGRRFYQEHLSRSAAVDRFEELFREVVAIQ